MSSNDDEDLADENIADLPLFSALTRRSEASPGGPDQGQSVTQPRPGTYVEAIARFRTDEGGWAALPFFRSGQADAVGLALDARAEGGGKILPSAADLFTALRLTPGPEVKAVILGQDPYPTPGDAHGLAFSVAHGGRLPASLQNIFKELQADLGLSPPKSGSLVPWAKRGVLLLNTCLTVEAGKAGSHRRLGWEELAQEVIAMLSAGAEPIVFVLWGNDARKRAAAIDRSKHLVIESAHPSPLSARQGFFGSRPFSRANDWLIAQGRAPIDWSLAPEAT